MSAVILPFRRRAKPVVSVSAADHHPGYAIRIAYPDGHIVEPYFVALGTPALRVAESLAKRNGWRFEP